MKYFLAIIAMMLAVNFSYAQWTGTSPGPIYYNNGNVGIGTTSPAYLLDVSGNSSTNDVAIRVRNSATTGGFSGVIRIENSSNYGLLFKAVTGYPRYKNINASDVGFYNQGAGNISFLNDYTTGNINFATGGAGTAQMIILPSGNIGIGTADTKGYKLAVNGAAIATSMTVKLYADWPDYVFKPTYQLPKLSEIKSYIDQNQHLPDMPSETEVKKDGINLGEIVKLQTKKIEELTLYLIEKDKQLDSEHKANQIQQTQIDQLKLQVETLIKKNL